MFEGLFARARNGDRSAEATTEPLQPAIVRPSIGLALGGGAARGFAHIGVMRTLIAHGIVPDVIVGTSIGAVVGGCYAAKELDGLETWARGLTMRGILSYLDISLSGSGLIRGGHLSGRLEEALNDKRIDDLPIRFAAIATEFDTGHEIWLTRGRLGRCAARFLRAAGNFSAGAHRRPLAGRRRTGQSGAGLGGARARRAAGDRRQSQFGFVRPRHHHFRSRLRRQR